MAAAVQLDQSKRRTLHRTNGWQPRDISTHFCILQTRCDGCCSKLTATEKYAWRIRYAFRCIWLLYFREEGNFEFQPTLWGRESFWSYAVAWSHWSAYGFWCGKISSFLARSKCSGAAIETEDSKTCFPRGQMTSPLNSELWTIHTVPLAIIKNQILDNVEIRATWRFIFLTVD